MAMASYSSLSLIAMRDVPVMAQCRGESVIRPDNPAAFSGHNRSIGALESAGRRSDCPDKSPIRPYIAAIAEK
jgi:hypothetical protein